MKYGYFAVAILGVLVGACGDQAANSAEDKAKGEEKQADAASRPQISLVEIAPGPAAPVNEINEERRKMIGDPDQIAFGKALYQAYNCVGCHFNGGGGIGPPLMDKTWIYGSSPEHIVATIREGRPAGMPTYRTMTTEEQRWHLAAYVLSLGGAPESAQ